MIPTGYQQIEYVQSNETGSYFNTGIVPDSNTRTIFDGYVVSGDTALYGSRYNNADNRYAVQFIGTEVYRLGYVASEALCPSSYKKGTRYTFDQQNGQLYIDNVLVATVNQTANFQNAREIYAVGALNTKGTATNLGVVRMYSMQIYQDDVLVRDFLPVQDSSGNAGIFDQVTQTFYANAGTGTVTGGLTLLEVTGIEITTPPTKTEYLYGTSFDTAGMVVTATYSDGSTGAITNYNISGYDGDIVGEQTVTVEYNGLSDTVLINVIRPTYTVTFQNWDGSVIEEQSVLYMDSAIAPVAQEREGYVFVGWDIDFSSITADITVVAQYEEKKDFSDLLNTIEGMEVIKNNSKQDDGTDTIDGVGWFRFNGVVASKIYINGNNWIGFGSSTEQLKICRRDGATYYVYRQSGTATNGHKFLKIRVEGYTYYSKITDEYKLVYELFLFDDNSMFLNVIQTPTNSGYIGTSALVCGSNTTSLDIAISTTPKISFHTENQGDSWSVENTWHEFMPECKCTVIFKNWNEDILKTELIVYGQAAQAPEVPAREGYMFIGWDVSFSSVTANMTITAQYVSPTTLYAIINTVEGMETIRNNVENNEGTDTINGVEWFRFNGVVASKIYINGNNWIGFGSGTEQLKICRRDGATYYVYRQIGGLTNGHKFLKIRVEGYTYYSSTSSPYKLIYELFLFDDNSMFLNVIQTPTYSSYIGTSALVCGFNTTSLDIAISTTPKISFYTENQGDSWSVENTWHEFMPEHTVSFVDWDGDVLENQTVSYEGTAIAPADPVREGYVFVGWDTGFSNIVQDTIITAQYEIAYNAVSLLNTNKGMNILNNTYLNNIPGVNWFKFNGDILEKLLFGPYYTGEGYLGWICFNQYALYLKLGGNYSRTYVTIYRQEGFITNGQKFLKIRFFIDKQQDSRYPTETIYKHIFELFLFDDNSMCLNECYNENDWTFNELHTSSNNYLLENIRIQPSAIYFKTEDEGKTWNIEYKYADVFKHTVIFKAWDGVIIEIQNITHKESAIPPKVPDREGYIFVGWDKIYEDIKEDLTITAIYIQQSEGKDICSLVDTTEGMEKYSNDWWTNDAWWSAGYDSISIKGMEWFQFNGTIASLIYIGRTSWIGFGIDSAQFKIISYNLFGIHYIYTQQGSLINGHKFMKIRVEGGEYYNGKISYPYIYEIFLFDDNSMCLNIVEYGLNEHSIHSSTTQLISGNYSYDVSTEIPIRKSVLSLQTENLGYKWNINQTWHEFFPWVIVSFQDWDKRIISFQKRITKGESAVAPEEPIRDGYKFVGWDKDFSCIEEDTVITAVYEQITFAVIFESLDGKILKTEIVMSGESATAPIAPTITGYTFARWDKEFSCVTTNMTITAVYTINVYQVQFADWNGEIFQSQNVNHGESAITPEEPIRYGYIFIGWDKEFENIIGNITITAIYKEYILKCSSSRMILYPGDTIQLSTIEEIQDNTLTWNNSNEEVAKIDENGLITAISEGIARITPCSDKTDSQNYCMVYVNGDSVEKSQEYQEYMNTAPSRKFSLDLWADGEKIDSRRVKKLKVVEYMMANEKVTIGQALSAILELDLYNVIGTIFSKKAITFSITTRINNVDDVEKFGTYYVSEVLGTSRDEVLNITAFDAVIKTAKELDGTLSYPATREQMEAYISEKCGIQFANNIGVGFSIPDDPKFKTYREMLGFLAAKQGCNAVANRTGRIEYKWFKSTERKADSSHYYTFKKDELESYIRKIKVKNDLGIFEYENLGSREDNAIDICLTGNQYMGDMVEFQAKKIAMRFSSGEVDFLGDPAVKAGDILKITDKEKTDNPESFDFPVMKNTMEWDGGVLNICEAYSESEEEQEYTASIKETDILKDLEEIKETVSNVDDFISGNSSDGTIESAVQNVAGQYVGGFYVISVDEPPEDADSNTVYLIRGEVVVE